jgi:hypothetical protein
MVGSASSVAPDLACSRAAAVRSRPVGVRTVTNKVASALRRRQWSHADLAAVTELPYPVVRRLVRGTNPPLEYALRIARVLDTPVESLFALDDPRAATPPGKR